MLTNSFVFRHFKILFSVFSSKRFSECNTTNPFIIFVMSKIFLRMLRHIHRCIAFNSVRRASFTLMHTLKVEAAQQEYLEVQSLA